MAGERPEDESWRDEGIIAGIRNGWPLSSFQRARLLDMLAPSPEPLPREALDVRRVAKAVENVAKRHGIVKDPPVEPVVARIWGYSAATPDMDAEIAAEYAALSPDRPTPP